MPGIAARTARRRSGSRNGEQGQILVLFVLGLVVILAVGALLLDGANSLVTRRRLQNVGDAAALAGANTIHASGSAHVCSTVSSSPPGAPRADIIAAVNASIATNWPSFPSGNITITCAQDALYNNQAVKVDLNIAASNFLGSGDRLWRHDRRDDVDGPQRADRRLDVFGRAPRSVEQQLAERTRRAARRSSSRAVRRSRSAGRSSSTRHARPPTAAPSARTATRRPSPSRGQGPVRRSAAT